MKIEVSTRCQYRLTWNGAISRRIRAAPRMSATCICRHLVRRRNGNRPVPPNGLGSGNGIWRLSKKSCGPEDENYDQQTEADDIAIARVDKARDEVLG